MRRCELRAERERGAGRGGSKEEKARRMREGKRGSTESFSE